MSVRNQAAKAMPRCGSTLWRLLEKADEPMCAPKGIDPTAIEHFSCKTPTSRVPKWGNGRRSWTPVAAGSRVSARAGGDGDAPVVAVLLEWKAGRVCGYAPLLRAYPHNPPRLAVGVGTYGDPQIPRCFSP
jgi:hypothetical protein